MVSDLKDLSVKDLIKTENTSGALNINQGGTKKDRIKKLDDLFVKLPTYGVRGKTGYMQYFKTFPNGISSLVNLTGRDYLSIIQFLPLVLLNSGDKLMPDKARIEMLKLLRLVHIMCWYIFETQLWNSKKIEEFANIVEEFTLLCHQKEFHSLSDMKFPKFHSLIHIIDMIKLYGSPRNFDTSAFEMAHKWFVKKASARSNFGSSTEESMIKFVENWKTINLIVPDKDCDRFAALDAYNLKIPKYRCIFGNCTLPLALGVTKHLSGFLVNAFDRLKMYGHMNLHFEFKNQINSSSLDVQFSKKCLLVSKDLLNADFLKKRQSNVEINAKDHEIGPIYAKVIAIMHVFKKTFVIVDSFEEVRWSHDTLPFQVNVPAKLKGSHPQYPGFP